MEARAGVRGSISAVIVAVGLMLGASGAQAEIIAPQHHPQQSDDGWQAGTCKIDVPTECSVDTPAQFFETAAGHPPVGFTQFITKQEPSGLPIGNLKTVRVDLPTGLSVMSCSSHWEVWALGTKSITCSSSKTTRDCSPFVSSMRRLLRMQVMRSAKSERPCFFS